MMSRNDVRAVEIDGDDAAWLRGRSLPAGVQLAEVDEVELWGRVYDRAPGSALYVPVDDDVVGRVVARTIAAAPEPAAPIGIDLFSGAGGFSVGMHEGGFDVVAAVEWDVDASITYLLNLGRPDCRIHFLSDSDRARWEKHMRKVRSKIDRQKERDAEYVSELDGEWMGSGYAAASGMAGGCRAFMFGDIAKLTGRQILDAAGVDHCDTLFGGPPCQGLSTANSKACLEDPRNALIWEYMRLVAEIHPKSFIIENVPAILTVAKGALFNAIAHLAHEAGYDVVATKLDACEYGVPQHRVRAIIVGTEQGSPGFRYPMPTHWAIGRPIDDDGWQMVDGFDRRNRPKYQRELPPQAHFDHATRRWSFAAGNEPASGSDTGRRDDAATTVDQLDWTEVIP